MTNLRVSPVSRTSTNFDARSPRLPAEQPARPQAAAWEVVEEVIQPVVLAPSVASHNVDLLLDQWRVERCERARDAYLHTLEN